MRTLEQAQTVACKVMETKFPSALAAFCAGSIVRGEATETSDIDLVVIFPKIKQAWRESFVVDGWPVEAFVHDRDTMKYFFEKIDAKSGVPSLPQMVAEGILVWGEASHVEQLTTTAIDLIKEGPKLLSDDDIRNRLYGITDLVDDFKSPRSRTEAIGIATRLYESLSDFALRSQGKWSGAGKQIPRALARANADLHDKFTAAFETFFRSGITSELIALAEELVEPFGGFVFDGYKREAPETWRVPGLHASTSEIRKARLSDLEAILAIDPIKEESRNVFVRDAIEDGHTLVYSLAGKFLAYAIFDRSFFNQSFIHLIVVKKESRKQGIAKALVEEIERQCRTSKIFTSTNESNVVAKAFFENLGFVESGVVHNLDEGDPEIVLFKRLTRSTPA